MKFILDCETKESTFESLSAIFNCNHSDLKSLLSEVDLEQIYELQWREQLIPYTEYVYNYVVKELGEPNSLDGVCWFHCTRTVMSNKFKEGILPLGESINRVWSMMLDIVKNSHLHQQLATMKKNGVNNFQYTLKTEDSVHWGPYGILIRDVAFYTQELSQHDYLELPEIIQDICNGYYEKYQESILDIYKKALSPCIVKFLSDLRVDQDCLETALQYAYSSVRRLPPNGGAVDCFDGEGKTIKNEQILSIKFL